MSEQTKRFRPSVFHDRESGLTFGRMEESLTGGFVFYEDYDQLRRQLAEAEAWRVKLLDLASECDGIEGVGSAVIAKRIRIIIGGENG